MLRRLVSRFSEEGGGKEGQTNAEAPAGGGISQKVVQEIELDVDSEEVSHHIYPSRLDSRGHDA